MKKRAHKINRLMIAAFACALTFLLSSDTTAQSITDGSTPLGISPGAPAGSYALSDLDSVNPYNGSLNFRLPLVKIAGRGGAGYTMVMRIEKKWLVEKEYGLGQPNKYYPNPNWWGEDGQEPTYSMGRLAVRQAGSTDYIIRCGGYIHRETLTRLTFTAPDGTEFELRDQLTNGRPDHPTCSTGFNRGRIFVTADGSSATFTSDSDISDYVYDNPGNFPPSGVLVLRDGTHYRIDGGLVTWMRNRNGNKVTFTYNYLQQLISVTDSLNRQVTIDYSTETIPYDQITVKGFGGAARSIKIYKGSALRSDYSALTYQQLFPELNGASNTTFTPGGVTAVQLPNGQQYQFQYNSYAELARVVLPTGGAIEYDYAAGLTDGAASGVLPIFNGDKHIYRRVIERRVYPDGGSGATYASRMTYSRPESSTSNAGYVIADQYNSSGALLNRSHHYFYGSPRVSFGQQPTQYPGWKDGREYQTTVFAANGTTPLQQATSVFAQRAPVSWWTGGADQEPPNDPRLVEQTTTLMDTNQVSKQTFGYDDSVPFNNQNSVREYDFGTGAAGALLRETRTTYVTSTNYTDTTVSLLSLPSQTSVWDGGGVERARTTFEYDNYNTDTYHAGLVYRSNISGLDAAFTTSYATRGNVTATTNYFLTNGTVTGSITSFAQYDVAGNAVKMIDARGNPTYIDFADRFGSPDGEARNNSGATELGGQMSYAFPTLVTNGLGQTAYIQFDYYLGRAVDGEDANGVVSSSYFNDALDRPKQVIRGSNQGTGIKSQSTIDYDDINRVITTTGDLTTYGDNLLKSQVVYDAMGRVSEKRQYESANGYIAVRQTYDFLGRSYQTSNPFRSGDTIVWTTTAYDVLNLVDSVTTPDSAVVGTSYSGNTVTVTDQAGKQRKSVSDALGRLTQVYEDPNGLNYLTSYSYDTLDSLITVTQGTQPPRQFGYDSLKRLTSASNPESGTVSYQYDNNGNLTQKTDARGIVSVYAYDALNRNTTVDYSNTTVNPDILRYYDNPINYGKGRYWYDYYYKDDGTINHQAVDGYDALGRTWVRRQVFYSGGQWYHYESRQTFDLADNLKSMQYPSGRTVTYDYDAAARLSNFNGNLGDGTQRSYANDFQYTAWNGLQQEKFGTSTAIYHKQRFNSRGQLWDMRASTVSFTSDPTNGDRGAIVNYYSSNFVQGGSGADNNGNLLRQENYIPGSDYFQDNFAYDSLNRLSSIGEKTNGAGADVFKQAYNYDRWGNRTIDQTNTWGTGIPKPNFTVDGSNNRLTAPAGYTMGYDAVGNLTTDTFTGEGARVYDAENRMTQAWANNQWQIYSYDADGHRARRKVNGTETWQVYGPNGELLAEYAATAAAATPQKEYGYRNGQLLITTDASSDVVWIEDSLPAGAWSCVCGWNEAWSWVTTNPTPQSGAAADTTVVATGLHQQFFQNATQTLTVNTGESLVAYVYLDSANMPSELMLQFYEGVSGWEHRAYWGADNIAWGVNGTVSRHYMGALPTGGQWVRLEIPAAAVGLEGSTLNGFAVTLYNGKASFDHIGKTAAGSGGGGTSIHWLVTDQLGTPRMIFDQTGSLANVSRHDYLPFGEELFAGVGGRTTAQGYTASDGVRQKFTSKERDNETGLDYFGARYYSSTQGRFTSPDPLSVWMIERKKQDEYIANPQRWNKYAYVLNNPLRYVDPDGLAEIPGWNDLDKKLREDLAKRLGKDAAKIWNGWSNDQRQGVLNVRASLIEKGVWGDVTGLTFGNVSTKDNWGSRNTVNFTRDNSQSASALAITSNKNLEWVFAGNPNYERESAMWNHPEARTTFKQKGDDIILHAIMLDRPADDYTALHFDSGGGSILNSEHRSDWWNKTGPSPDRVSTGLGKTGAAQHLKGISVSLDKLLTQKK